MTDHIGLQLGNYITVQLLGRGGFADVYLAEHLYLKTQVAVKVLQARLSAAEDMQSFLQEAQLIARLSHPHIIRVLDFGLAGEIPFLVMDYAQGGTLRQLHPRGKPLPLTLVVSYVKQLADALYYAHNEKVIHRDLKPENMLFGKRHEVLISDFGIALISQSSRYQGTQEVAGTAAYMSPEQIQGKARAASDQYSLGIVAYEWLSGDRPFRGSFTEICTQHLFASPPALREKVPALPSQVEQVLTIALAKDPRQRFGNILAFANALEQASQSPAAGMVLLPDSPLVPLTRPQTPAGESVMPVSNETEASPPSILPEIPPTVLASPPEVPVASPPYPQSQGPASLATPGSTRQSDKPAPVTARRSAWGIGNRQIAAIIVGTILFGIINYPINLFFVAVFNGDPNASVAIETLNFNLLDTAVGLSLIVPGFFAAISGPWVGLVCATLGTLLGNALSSTLSASFNPWYTYITYAIFGFFAGLAFVRTGGHYKTRGALVFLAFVTSIGVILSMVWQSIGNTLSDTPAPVTDFYIPLVLIFCLFGIPLLICLLIGYERVVPSQRSA